MKHLYVYLTIFTFAFFTALPHSVSLAESAGARSETGSRVSAINTEIAATHALGTATSHDLRKHSHRQRFVEFRGELTYFPGNTVIRHGFLGPDGEQAEYEAVSFQGEYGMFGLMVGSFVPLPGKVGVYSWDDVGTPGRSYQVKITEQQHMRLIDFIEKRRAEKQTFFLYTNNCVRFAKEAALVIGLKVPKETFFLMPPVFVNSLRFLNGG